MATYIDSDYIDAHIKADVRQGLFTDGGTYSSTAVAQCIVTASERVKVAGELAGYSMSSTTTTDELVKQATLGQFVALAYGRNGLTAPEQFYTEIRLADAIRTGTVKLTGTPNAAMAVGGLSVTSSDDTDAEAVASGEARPAVMKPLRSLW